MPNFRYATQHDARHAFPDNVFRRTSREPEDEALWLGVELETEPRQRIHMASTNEMNAVVQRANKTIGNFAITKGDGSVSYGFEINSVPGTLGWHKRAWKPFFADAGEYLRPSSACGMHVHVDLARLGDNNILAKLCGFINADHNRRFVTAIAGRGGNQYCQYEGDPDDVSTAQRKLSRIRNLNPINFSSVRIQRAEFGTAELRIFASTTEWSKFASRIEFVDAAARFARGEMPVEPVNGLPLSWQTFVAWLKQSKAKRRYPHLLVEAEAAARAA